MSKVGYVSLALLWCVPIAAGADPSLECGVQFDSQVEISECVSQMEAAVDKSMSLALEFAQGSARELDDAMGRASALPALEAGQAAWTSYRDAHCDFVGTTFGGGSGAGIAILACRVELGRARVAELMKFAR